ncbi:MAG: type II toxin-antitoxin system Phd/YefM family antitoxin [Symploca sp. SIO3E6]|nr:type II toxin-antitoxin system Phd/YefM family antitoxin [Caldora sp. SIO3E6]
MISLDNIHSFTQFQRNAKAFADQVRDSKTPIVLTVNGEAALVVHDAHAFQELLEQLRRLEKELDTLKLEALRSDLQIGIEQANQGEFSHQSIDQLKAEGRYRLAAEQQS